MQISIFSVWMTVLWSSILILIFYFFRTKSLLMDICSVTGVIILYLFCLVRMAIPIELPWTRVVFGGKIYNGLYDFLRMQIDFGIKISIYQIIPLIWMAGTIYLLVRLFTQYIKVTGYFGKLPVLKDEKIEEILAKMSTGKNKIPRVVKTSAIHIPCCMGVFRKTILLPDKTYSDEDMYYILLHEYSHLKNNDILTKILINIVCALYWWNPFVYLLKKDLNQSLEIRCDGIVVKGLDNEKRCEYLSVILKEFKDSSNTGKQNDIRMQLFEKHSEKMIERFQLVTSDRNGSLRRGNVIAWLIAGCLLIVSYSFIIQTEYDVPMVDIETNSEAHEVDNENSFLKKQSDGSYILHTENSDIPISEESAKQLMSDGFTVLEGR